MKKEIEDYLNSDFVKHDHRVIVELMKLLGLGPGEMYQAFTHYQMRAHYAGHAFDGVLFNIDHDFMNDVLNAAHLVSKTLELPFFTVFKFLFDLRLKEEYAKLDQPTGRSE